MTTPTISVSACSAQPISSASVAATKHSLYLNAGALQAMQPELDTTKTRMVSLETTFNAAN